MPRMEWSRLKEEKCPKCGAFLTKGIMYVCTMCDFRMSFGKVYEIIGKPIDLEKEANILLKKGMKGKF